MGPDTEMTVDHLAGGPSPTVIVDDVHVTYRIRTAPAVRPSLGRSPVRRRSRRRAVLRQVHAVRGVSFIAYRGQAIGLVGRNGSGKSTLLRAIAGLLPVDGGAIYIRDQPALLGVNAVLNDDLSGEQNVMLGLLAMGFDRAEAHQRLPEVIEFSGIDERQRFSTLPMRTYSTGMAARLRFAIAAARPHEVLLIDEALATGDAQFRRRSERRIRELVDAAGTVFVVSHTLATVVDMCDRLLWLDNGLLRMDGPTAEVAPVFEREVAQ